MTPHFTLTADGQRQILTLQAYSTIADHVTHMRTVDGDWYRLGAHRVQPYDHALRNERLRGAA